MNVGNSAPIRVTRLRDGDETALAAFYREAWSNGSTSSPAVESARRQLTAIDPFSGEPFSLVVAVYAGDRIIGHLGTIPTQFWDGTRLVSAVWLKGFMVLEPYRNGPCGFMLIRELAKHTTISAAMTVAAPARRLMEAVGLRDVGTLRNYVTVLRPRHVLKRLDVRGLGLGPMTALSKLLGVARTEPFASICGAIAALGLRLLEVANRLVSAGRLSADTAGNPPPRKQIDELWAKLRDTVGFAPSRSGDYVEWRYAGAGTNGYRFISIRDTSGLRGLVVVRGPRRRDDSRLGGLQIALIADLIVDVRDHAAISRALLEAKAWGRRSGYDALLFTMAHGAVGRLARRLGFIGVPGDVHFMFNPGTQDVVTPVSIDACWLTRGDAWGDDI